MIIKVQRPIFPADGDWRIYDKEKKHAEVVTAGTIPAYVKTALGKDFKAYFNGEWSSIVGWAIGDRVKDQNW